MDWVKLFALLVAVSSVAVIAQGARKKIRIHLPQKVKHIHHHKKIYITNHPASSQYAPAYLPTAEGAVAVPTTVALPTVAGLVPLKPMQLFEERQTPTLQGISPAASKILPLYRARGYYGPSPEWEEQEFDLVPPPEHLGPTAAAAVLPSAFSAPSAPAASANYPPKRVKVVKVSDSPRKKKVIRKRKPKRIIIQEPHREEEHPPVSTFHEHFYSDLEGAGTIRKIKKPKRVEKIIDGDTEHIHTYSEEHIHKVVFDDSPKITGVAGIDTDGSMSALTASHPLVPLKNSQSLLALDTGDFAAPFGDLSPVGGSLGTPSQFEFASYNPRDVTHDHIFHDHGELPGNLDITKETLAHPPKVSYNSQGLKINGANIKSRPKNKWKKPRPTRPTPSLDFSYYENMYSPPTRPRKYPRQPNNSHKFFDDSSEESNLEGFRPIPNFNFKESKPKIKNHGYHGYNKPSSFRLGQESVPVPFSTVSTIIHDEPIFPQKNAYSGIKASPLGFSNFKDPFNSFKGIYTNNFEYDTYASSSNVFNKDSKPNAAESSWPLNGKSKKKSISTQNISFGGQDHKTVVDHLADSSNVLSSKETLSRPSSSVQTFEDFNTQKSDESATPSMEYTITEHSPAHDYYTAMALKAFNEDPMSVPEASNTNFQIVEAPTQTSPTPSMMMSTTSRPTPTFFNIPSETPTTAETRTSTLGKKLSKRLRSRPTMSIPRPTSSFNENENSGSNTRSLTTEYERREALHRYEQEYQRARRAGRNIRAKVNEHLESHPTSSSQFKYGDKL